VDASKHVASLGIMILSFLTIVDASKHVASLEIYAFEFSY
jgi:hypothetical protein